MEDREDSGTTEPSVRLSLQVSEAPPGTFLGRIWEARDPTLLFCEVDYCLCIFCCFNNVVI